MSNSMHLRRAAWIGGAVLALSLAACGGGGSGGSPAASTGGSAAASAPSEQPAAAASAVPDSASASAAGFADFQRAMTRDDTAEPIQIGAFRPPKHDTAEPTALK